jgi:predicted GIY-YIG superfamily endonuclease
MLPKYLKIPREIKTVADKEWSVYILRCGDGTLYTGIAKNVKRRVDQHGRGRGAAYTRTRLPVELLYSQASLNQSQALIQEAAIKRLPRTAKEKLISERGV